MYRGQPVERPTATQSPRVGRRQEGAARGNLRKTKVRYKGKFQRWPKYPLYASHTWASDSTNDRFFCGTVDTRVPPVRQTLLTNITNACMHVSGHISASYTQSRRSFDSLRGWKKPLRADNAQTRTAKFRVLRSLKLNGIWLPPPTTLQSRSTRINSLSRLFRALQSSWVQP